jgi:hypothetical protein
MFVLPLRLHMQLTPIKLVIASPEDVKAERSVVALVVDELNKTLAQKVGFTLIPLMWETDANRGRALLGTADKHYVSAREMKETYEEDDLQQLILHFGRKIVRINNDSET